MVPRCLNTSSSTEWGEANRLFRETDMNVSEAAVAVGYSNISHFSNAYKKHFGILPKKHLLRIKDVLCHHIVCLISIKKSVPNA